MSREYTSLSEISLKIIFSLFVSSCVFQRENVSMMFIFCLFVCLLWFNDGICQMSDNSPPQIRAAICSPHTPNICCNWCVSSAFHTTDDQAADALGRMWWVIGWFDTPHRQSFSTDVGLFCPAIYISSVIRMARIRTWWWARVRIDLPLCAAHSQLHDRWRRKKRIYCLNQRQTDKTVKLIPFFSFFFWMYNVQRRCGPANRIAYPYYYFKSWWYTLWGDGKQSRHKEWRWWRVLHCALVNGRDVRHHSISIVEHTHM